MRSVYRVLLAGMLVVSGCAYLPFCRGSVERRNALIEKDAELSRRQAEIERLRCELEQKESELKTKDAQVQEMKKKLRSFGVF